MALAQARLVLLLRALIPRVLILALSVIAPRLIRIALLVLILPAALALSAYLVHLYAIEHDDFLRVSTRGLWCNGHAEGSNDVGERLKGARAG
jgi:hypothetical protein